MSSVRTLRAPAASVAIVAGLLLAAISAWLIAAPVRAAETHAVQIAGFAFSPADLTITVGDTVTWTNADGMAHTATASGGAFDSGNLDDGDSFSFTFTSAGTFDYICSLHPTMTGTITVQAAAPPPSSPAQSTTPDTAMPAAGNPAPPAAALLGLALLLAGLAVLGSRRQAKAR